MDCRCGATEAECVDHRLTDGGACCPECIHQNAGGGEHRLTDAVGAAPNWESADAPPPHPPCCSDALYYCPSAGNVECGIHGGFNVCCEHPEHHLPASVERDALEAGVGGSGAEPGKTGAAPPPERSPDLGPAEVKGTLAFYQVDEVTSDE